ncbi:MAG: hypothetical protein ACLVJ6_13630 [Merdibacter sp.]
MIAAVKRRASLSFVKEEDLEIMKHNTIDFLGQNIYSRMVKPNTSGITLSPSMEQRRLTGAARGDGRCRLV